MIWSSIYKIWFKNEFKIKSTLNFKEINVLNTGINKSLKLKNLAANISTYNYNSLSKVPVELGNINKTENYIPNISKANQLGLKSYIPLELQIEDSLNFHYSRNLLWTKL